ncbi:hypothetical protein EVAR_2275_1 [Eumeta japonica]|uniref:Uncharacterized protein n=1 Tax=Eumeta variegata TaxID=151549 RepID=A0A4C1SFP7_EUMVA|nr:hypothetical protein EVAR_2275_1 [Eumeta japonica]
MRSGCNIKKKHFAIFQAKAVGFESVSGLINSEYKNRFRARFVDLPKYRTQVMEAYEALLATLNDSKTGHKAVLAKVDADYLKIFELTNSIKQAFNDLRCGKESEHTAGCGSSSAYSDDARGSISRLPTLSLT